MSILNRRMFLELLAALGISSACEPIHLTAQQSDEQPANGTYHPGRIENEYSLFLVGEREALQTPPTISSVAVDALTAQSGDQLLRMRPGDSSMSGASSQL